MVNNLAKLSNDFESVDFYRDYIKDYINLPNIDPNLSLQLSNFILTVDFDLISKLWLKLICLHLERLEVYGIKDFKMQIGRHYSSQTWNPKDQKFKQLVKKSEHSIIVKDLMKMNKALTPEQCVTYNIATCLLYDLVKKIDSNSVLEKLTEPDFGNPLSINCNDCFFSQPYLNAVLDYFSISEQINLDNSRVLEIGGGGGNLLSVVYSLHSRCSYVIIDFPPALYLAQSYAKHIFQHKNIISYKDYKNSEELSSNILDADILFLMPHQINLLKEINFDLVLAIDVLYNLTKPELDQYFDIIDCISNNFYYKTLYDSTAQNIYQDKTYKYDEYPVRESWELLSGNTCYFPETHYEAFYRVKKS